MGALECMCKNCVRAKYKCSKSHRHGGKGKETQATLLDSKGKAPSMSILACEDEADCSSQSSPLLRSLLTGWSLLLGKSPTAVKLNRWRPPHCSSEALWTSLVWVCYGLLMIGLWQKRPRSWVLMDWLRGWLLMLITPFFHWSPNSTPLERSLRSSRPACPPWRLSWPLSRMNWIRWRSFWHSWRSSWSCMLSCNLSGQCCMNPNKFESESTPASMSVSYVREWSLNMNERG